MYTIIRREEKHVVIFSVDWEVGGNSVGNEMSVRLSGDGCLGITLEKKFLYPSEADVFAQAILAARTEHESKQRAAENEWLKENGDKTALFSFPVSLSINDTFALLKSAPIQGGNIFFSGKWLRLARTDLKDDVCTTHSDMPKMTREDWQKAARYGARIKADTFAVIDSVTDG